jgi:Cu2+-exporting ATPase
MHVGPFSREYSSDAHVPEGDARSATACAYCGEPLTAKNRVVREVLQRRQSFCCLGCAFIAEQLSLMPMPAPDPASILRGEAQAPIGTPTCVQLDVRGMVCAACAQLIEHRLQSLPGVCSASVDFVAHRALVVYDPQGTEPAELIRQVERTGYRVRSGDDLVDDRRSQRIELLRVLLAWLAMMQVMMLAVPSYLARAGEITPDIEQMLRIGQLILSAPVAVFCAAPFWRAALSQLRIGRAGMDVPVALGLASALGASALATATGKGAVYFDSVTMFVALLLAVRWWQMRALARTTAQVDAAARQTRLRARRLRRRSVHGAFDTVPAEQLQPGEFIVVPVGEAIAADGRIVEGSTSVSQAWLTGESVALDKSEGETVLAGSLNLGQAIVVQVTRAGDATSLAALQRMIIDAAAKRPTGVEFTQRVAAHFAIGVLALAVLTALYWLGVDPARAARATIAVLVVTCPCALSLAAPLAFAVAQARLAACGVLLTRPAALEALADVDTIAFDKTGTLTEARPHLLTLEVLGSQGRERCLEIAAGLEAHSQHPFALALTDAARQRSLAPVNAVRVAEVPGMGIEGVVAGKRYRLGKAEYALALTPDPVAGAAVLSALQDQQSDAALSHVLLTCQDGPIALLCFGETLRADAARLLAALSASGRGMLLLSGDSPAAVERVARQLDLGSGLPLERFADQSPAGKRRLLEQRQRAGHRVAMIGDGINDAPVIAQADASIALASGSRLAQVRADVIVLGSELEAVYTVFALARRTKRTVRQNLQWALAYNVVMVPLAGLGLLAPWLAAVGMAASSGFVLVNSLRLRAAPLA